jgi:hypothetical protein
MKNQQPPHQPFVHMLMDPNKYTRKCNHAPRWTWVLGGEPCTSIATHGKTIFFPTYVIQVKAWVTPYVLIMNKNMTYDIIRLLKMGKN